MVLVLYSPPALASTASTIISYIEGIAKFDSQSIGIPGLEQTILLAVIDKANREYYNKFLIGGGEARSDRSAETGGTIIAGTELAEGVTSATTDFDVDSSSAFVSSGALAIWDNLDPDFCEFTANAANNFSGVTGIDYNHETNDAVTQLYALPSNFESFRSDADSAAGVKVDGIAYHYTTGVPVSNEFAVYDNGTTKYLFFPRDLTGDYSVRYNKGATTISSTSSTIDVPVADEDFVIYRGVEHAYRVLNIDPNKVQEARNIADRTMLSALKRRNVGKRLRPGRFYNVGGYRNAYPPSESVNQFIF